MGKNKKKTMSGGDSQHSPSTIFVNNLPYSFTNAQLEETFSEVGPIRRCFMVTNKGSSEHRGFGFVQFASVDDANRSIELKNGSMVGGRKIGVKQAMQRVPREQRQLKGDQESTALAKDGKDGPSTEAVEQKQASKPQGTERTAQAKDGKDGPSTEAVEQKQASKPQGKESTAQAKDSKDSPPTEAVKHKRASNAQGTEISGKPTRKRKAALLSNAAADEGNYSGKQRVARTVIIGGIVNVDMAKEAHQLAAKCGTICSVTYPLPKEEIENNGLAHDGCKMDASSVLFPSVKSAQACVASLHQKEVHGTTLWARQLGGEGSKTQRWKLIVRNLPFKAKVNEIKDLFSKVGFVWDVFIPKNFETGSSKGFAFVKFTSKQHAENAIKTFNGKTMSKRTIAVDWAVSKKVYASGGQSSATAEDEQSAKDNSGSDTEDEDIDIEGKSQQAEGDEDDSDLLEEDIQTEFNFDEEANIAKKVLQNFISPTSIGPATSTNDISNPPKQGKEVETVLPLDEALDASTPNKALDDDLGKGKETNTMQSEGADDLQGTIFISNLPFDADYGEVKQRFAAFGEVEYFAPVLERITKRPRGTGFLKFKTAASAEAAISAASDVDGLGVFLKGRQLKILKALDKKAAHDKELEKTKKEDNDHRNLYLAKEGLILEGTPAAEGVSMSDMSKRKGLQEKKIVKLKSPNFHVSRTRLIIYNIPKSMTEKQLKTLCIDAVTSRATKQKPVIRQIKFLKDVKKGQVVTKNHSRGVAFLEFSEHEHALVALRVLNNNPETFGPEHRPIVEFALDNIQTMKLRQKLQQQQGFNRNREDMQPNNNKNEWDPRDKQSRKRKGDALSVAGNRDEAKNKRVKGATSGEGNVSSVSGSRDGDQPKNKGVKGAISAEERNEKKNKKEGKKLGGAKEKPKNNREGKKHGGFGSENSGNATPKVGHKEDITVRTTKRKFKDKSNEQKQNISLRNGKKDKKKKDPVGRDGVDKLDMLIEQYTSKFRHNSSNQTDSNQKGSKQLKRWFQS
ncbi:uncharacterized protein LOC132599203 [Lycium barbarum]|uniref:uncharacterized protein LOC132599203 n=1 Tax=Lycium barbarum TaxID=112863 RepID=UPI00293E374C|nr:uncharacterized protein LOC132599203 [Lycium barbarum]